MKSNISLKSLLILHLQSWAFTITIEEGGTVKLQVITFFSAEIQS
jgi:hypothetical protein